MTSATPDVHEHCPTCGQAETFGGEYPCRDCGRPTLHDPDARERGAGQWVRGINGIVRHHGLGDMETMTPEYANALEAENADLKAKAERYEAALREILEPSGRSFHRQMVADYERIARNALADAVKEAGQ